MSPRNPKGRDIREKVNKQRVEEKRFKHQQFENELGRCPICGHPTLRLERSKQFMFIRCTNCSASDYLPLRQGWKYADYHSKFLDRVHRRYEEFYQSFSPKEQSALESISFDDIKDKIFYCVVKHSRKQIVEFRDYSNKFGKHINIIYRTKTYRRGLKTIRVRQCIGYAFVKGNFATISMMIRHMRDNGVWLKILGTSASYESVKHYVYSKGTWKNRKALSR